MTHYVNRIVFRMVTKGSLAGTLEAVMADVATGGLTTVADGGTYDNEWYITMTRPATPEEYSEELRRLNNLTFAGDTYEFIPVHRRQF